ncbi:MAG TPA: hypothetical protein VMI54_13710 [Polyangiaceae bacterium]|nr:hypothetical protein [Polyangiaceae bacterium]
MLPRVAGATAALLLIAPGVRAEPPAAPTASAPTAAPPAVSPSESSGSFGDRFFRGTSPGELPTEKLALIATLYVGAATSVGVGVATLFSASSKHDDAESFKHSQPRYFCDDLASPACATYRRLLDEERSRRETGYVLLGLGGLLVLGGGITAELWHNDAVPAVALSVGPGELTLGVSGNF